MITRVVAVLVVLALLGGGAWYVVSLRNQPPEASFTRVVREDIANSVPTNGKVEPIEWAEARAERAGAVQGILIQRGGHVAKGAAIAELDSGEARAELVAAQARISQIHAELETLDKGGRPADFNTINGEIERQRLELAAAQREHDTLQRLQGKQAATSYEVTQAKDRIERAQALAGISREEFVRALRDGPTTVAALARTTGFPRERVGEALDGLVRDGLVAAGPAALRGAPGGRARLRD